jgi:hypothetical protein
MDNPVKTRVHELLGVEPNERFIYRGYLPETVMYVDECGTMRRDGGEECGSSMLAKMILNKSEILRRPALNDEQRKVLLWLHKGGFTHVTKDDAKSFCTDRRNSTASVRSFPTGLCRST